MSVEFMVLQGKYGRPPSRNANAGGGTPSWVQGAEPLVRRSPSTLAPLLSFALIGCEVRGAPSFEIVGSYFPGWMFCALIGIVSAIAVRVSFVASGLASVLPLQLFVCTSIGVCCALLAWLLWFG
jgi:YtcA family